LHDRITAPRFARTASGMLPAMAVPCSKHYMLWHREMFALPVSNSP
jgi:hypothetical protein